MTAFRDEIASLLVEGVDQIDATLSTAEMILAMPEMQAIAELITAVGLFGIGVIDGEALMATYYELPESVDEWVHQ